MLWITITEEVSSFFLRELGGCDGALQAARWPGVGRWQQSYGAERRGRRVSSRRSIVDNSNCATTVLQEARLPRTYARLQSLASVI